jgi:hypothetical protein
MSEWLTAAQAAEIRGNYKLLSSIGAVHALHSLCTRISEAESAEICRQFQTGAEMFTANWSQPKGIGAVRYPEAAKKMSDSQRKGFYLHKIQSLRVAAGQAETSAANLAYAGERELRKTAERLTVQFVRRVGNAAVDAVTKPVKGDEKIEYDDAIAMAAAQYAAAVNGALPIELTSCPELLGAGAVARRKLNEDAKTIYTVINTLLLVANTLELAVIGGVTSIGKFMHVFMGNTLLKTVETVTSLALSFAGADISKLAKNNENFRIFEKNKEATTMANYKLTQEEAKSIESLTGEMLGENNNSLTLEENMQHALSERIQGVDVQQIVSGINKGIERFDASLEEMENAATLRQWVSDKLTAALVGKSVAERYNTLLSLFNALSISGSERLGTEPLRFTPIENAEPTEENVAELNTLIAEYLDSGAVLYFDDETIGAVLNSVGEETGQKLLDAAWSEQARPYLALATYILRTKGELSSVPLELGPEEIGVSTAAATAREQAVRDGATGRKPWETVLNILKKIAVVSATLLAVYVVAKAALFVGSIVFIFTRAFVGLGAIGLLVAAVAGGAVGKSILDNGIKLLTVSKEVVKIAVVKVVEYCGKIHSWIKEKVIPAISAFWTRVKNAVSSGISAFSAAAVKYSAADAEAALNENRASESAAPEYA